MKMATEIVSFDPDSDLQLILTTAEEQGSESTTTVPAPTITSDATIGTADNVGDTVNQVSAGAAKKVIDTDGLGSDTSISTPSKREI